MPCPLHARHGIGRARIQRRQLLLERLPRQGVAAPHADDRVRGAVELQHVCRPCLLVQAVHVLGDQRPRPAAALQARQALVRSVGTHAAELMPARKGARPVALACRLRRHELRPARKGGGFGRARACRRATRAPPRACWCVMGLKPVRYAPSGPR